MKNLFKLSVLLFSLCLYSCSSDDEPVDPCLTKQCSFSNLGNLCENGRCQCESENFSFFQWKWRCQSCGLNQFIPARLEVNGSIIGNYIVGQPADETVVIKIPTSGQVPFRVISTTSGNVVEEGNISLIQCELVSINSIY